VGLRAGLDRCGKSRLTGIRSPDLPGRSEPLYRLRYPDPTFCVPFAFFGSRAPFLHFLSKKFLENNFFYYLSECCNLSEGIEQ
jgi:hypothetical protein